MINTPLNIIVYGKQESFRYRGRDNYHKSIAVVKSSATLLFKPWAKQGFLTICILFLERMLHIIKVRILSKLIYKFDVQQQL